MIPKAEASASGIEMDVRQMIDFHHQNYAHVSVAAIPIPLAEASAFGIIHADRAGRIKGFL